MRQQLKCTCSGCGSEFYSTSYRAKWCSEACRLRTYRKVTADKQAALMQQLAELQAEALSKHTLSQ